MAGFVTDTRNGMTMLRVRDIAARRLSQQILLTLRRIHISLLPLLRRSACNGS